MPRVADRRVLYVLIFYAHYGEGPHACFFCNESVFAPWKRKYRDSRLDLAVHHRNEDHVDDDPENLAAAHRACHLRYHNTGRKHSLITRQKCAEAKRRWWAEMTPEQHELQVAATSRGIRKQWANASPEARRKRVEAAKAGAAARWNNSR